MTSVRLEQLRLKRGSTVLMAGLPLAPETECLPSVGKAIGMMSNTNPRLYCFVQVVWYGAGLCLVSPVGFKVGMKLTGQKWPHDDLKGTSSDSEETEDDEE